MSGNAPTGTEPDGSHPLARPVWTAPAAWAEANQALDLLCRRYRSGLGPAREQARRVATALETLSDLNDDLAALTCPFCGDPCCRKAKIWLNFQDLLFLHLFQGPIPLHQLRVDLKEPCRFLGERGCTLPRLCRPWICTWYLCPAQTSLLRKLPKEIQIGFEKAVREVKEGRREMEEEFVRVVGV